MGEAPTDPRPGKSIEFLFLASHGLLSPISSIRWGSNRLRRIAEDSFTGEQRELVEHIHSNAKMLTKLFGAMLLLARNEDGTYVAHPEPLLLKDFLRHQEDEWRETNSGTVTIVCPADLRCAADPGMMEMIVQNLFAVFSTAGDGNAALTIEAKQTDGWVEITFLGHLELAFLQGVQTVRDPSLRSHAAGGATTTEVKSVVGGTQGLLLSLAQSLLWFLDGTLDMRETSEETYAIVARIPLEAGAGV